MSTHVFCLICTPPSSGCQLVATVALPLSASLYDVREFLSSRMQCIDKCLSPHRKSLELEVTSQVSFFPLSDVEVSNISKEVFYQYYKDQRLFAFDFSGEYRFVRYSSHLVPKESEKNLSLERCFPTVPRMAMKKSDGGFHLTRSFEHLWVELLQTGKCWSEKCSEKQDNDRDMKSKEEMPKSGGATENIIPTVVLKSQNPKVGAGENQVALCILYVTAVERIEVVSTTTSITSTAVGASFLTHRHLLLRQASERVTVERCALSPLTTSSSYGRIFEADDIWTQGISPWNANVRDYLGHTLLHEVVILGVEEAFSVLLTAMSQHIDVNAKDFQGNTALHWAVYRYRPKLKFVEQLLEAGADPLIPNKVGNTPLHLSLSATDKEGKRKRKGRCVPHSNLRSVLKPERDTGLSKEWEERLALSSLLCNYCIFKKGPLGNAEKSKKKDVWRKDSSNKISVSTPFAALYSSVNEILALRNKIDVSIHCLFRPVLFSFVDLCRNGSCEELEKISQHALFEPKCVARYTYDVWNGFSPLHLAAESGNTECLKYFVKVATLHFSKRDRNVDPITAVLRATCRKPMDVQPSREELGYVLCPQDCLLRTPLHVAAARGQLDCVKVLVRSTPFALCLVDSQGNTPFLLAAKSSSLARAIAILHYFINELECETSQLAPHAPDIHGYTVLHFLCSRGLFSLASDFIKRFGIPATQKTSPFADGSESQRIEAQETSVSRIMDAAASYSSSSSSSLLSRKDPPMFFRPLKNPESLFFTSVVAASHFPLLDSSHFLFYCLTKLGMETTLEDVTNLILYLFDKNQLKLIEVLLRCPGVFEDPSEVCDTASVNISLDRDATLSPLLRQLRDNNVLLCYFCHRKDHYGIRWSIESHMYSFTFFLKNSTEEFLRQRSPLHISIFRGDVESVKFLLDAGAHVPFSNPWTSIPFLQDGVEELLQEGCLSSLFPLGWALQQPFSHEQQSIISTLIRETNQLHVFACCALTGPPSTPSFLKEGGCKEGTGSTTIGPYCSTGLLWSALVEAAVQWQEEVVRGLVGIRHLYPEATLALQQMVQNAAKKPSLRFCKPAAWSKLTGSWGEKSCKNGGWSSSTQSRKERESLSIREIEGRILGYLAPLFDPFYCTLHPFELLHLTGCAGFLDIATILVRRIRLSVERNMKEGTQKQSLVSEKSDEVEECVTGSGSAYEIHRYLPHTSSVMTASSIKASAVPPPTLPSEELAPLKSKRTLPQKCYQVSRKKSEKLARLTMPTKCSSLRVRNKCILWHRLHTPTDVPQRYASVLPHRVAHRDIFSYAAERGAIELMEELFALTPMGLTPWPEGDILGQNPADYALNAGQPAAFRMLVWRGISPLKSTLPKVCCSFSWRECILSSAVLRACKKVPPNNTEVPSDKVRPCTLFDRRVCQTVKELLIETGEAPTDQSWILTLSRMTTLLREVKKWSCSSEERNNTSSSLDRPFPSWLPTVATLCVRYARHSLPLLRVLVKEFDNGILGIQNSSALVAAVSKSFIDKELWTFLISTCGCSPFSAQLINNSAFMWAILEDDMYNDGRKPVHVNVSPIFLAVLLGKTAAVKAFLETCCEIDNGTKFGLGFEKTLEKARIPTGKAPSSFTRHEFFSFLTRVVGSGKKGEDPFLALITRIRFFRSSAETISAAQVQKEAIETLRLLSYKVVRKEEEFPEVLTTSTTISALIREAGRARLFEIIVSMLECYGAQFVISDLKICATVSRDPLKAISTFRNSFLHIAASHEGVCKSFRKVIKSAEVVVRGVILENLKNCAKAASSLSHMTGGFVANGDGKGNEPLKNYGTFCNYLSLAPGSLFLSECLHQGSPDSITFFLSLGFTGLVKSKRHIKILGDTNMNGIIEQKILFREVVAALHKHAFRTFQYYTKEQSEELSPPAFTFFHSVVESGGKYLLERLASMSTLFGLPTPLLVNPAADVSFLTPRTAATSTTMENTPDFSDGRSTFFSSSILSLVFCHSQPLRNHFFSFLLHPFLFPDALKTSDIISYQLRLAHFLSSPENICHMVLAAHELPKELLTALDRVFRNMSDDVKKNCFERSVNLTSFSERLQCCTRTNKNGITTTTIPLFSRFCRYFLKEGSPLAVAVGASNVEWTSHIIDYLSARNLSFTKSGEYRTIHPQCIVSKFSMKTVRDEKNIENRTGAKKYRADLLTSTTTTEPFFCNVLMLSVIVLCQSRSLFFKSQRSSMVSRSEENVQVLLQSSFCETNLTELNVIAIALAAMEHFHLLEILIQKAEYLLRFSREREKFFDRQPEDCKETLCNENILSSDPSTEATSIHTRDLLFIGITAEEIPPPLRYVIGSHRHVLQAMAAARNLQPELLCAIVLRSSYSAIQNFPDAKGRYFMYLVFRRFFFTNSNLRCVPRKALEKEEISMVKIWDFLDRLPWSPTHVCCDREGQNLLHLAAAHGCTSLLDKWLHAPSRDVSPLSSGTRDGERHSTSLPDLAKNDPDRRGWTPLMLGCRYGHKSTVELLLSWRKEDLHVRDAHGHSAVMHAALNGHDQIVLWIIKNFGVLDEKKWNFTEKEVGETLVSERETLLIHCIARGGCWRSCEALITMTAEPWVLPFLMDINGNTPLQLAIAFNHQRVVAALLHAVRMAELLRDACFAEKPSRFPMYALEESRKRLTSKMWNTRYGWWSHSVRMVEKVRNKGLEELKLEVMEISMNVGLKESQAAIQASLNVLESQAADTFFNGGIHRMGRWTFPLRWCVAYRYMFGILALRRMNTMDNCYALHLAACCGFTDIAELLLALGMSNPSCRGPLRARLDSTFRADYPTPLSSTWNEKVWDLGSAGFLPFEVAALNGYKDCALFLLEALPDSVLEKMWFDLCDCVVSRVQNRFHLLCTSCRGCVLSSLIDRLLRLRLSSNLLCTFFSKKARKETMGTINIAKGANKESSMLLEVYLALLKGEDGSGRTVLQDVLETGDPEAFLRCWNLLMQLWEQLENKGIRLPRYFESRLGRTLKDVLSETCCSALKDPFTLSPSLRVLLFDVFGIRKACRMGEMRKKSRKRREVLSFSDVRLLGINALRASEYCSAATASIFTVEHEREVLKYQLRKARQTFKLEPTRFNVFPPHEQVRYLQWLGSKSLMLSAYRSLSLRDVTEVQINIYPPPLASFSSQSNTGLMNISLANTTLEHSLTHCIMNNGSGGVGVLLMPYLKGILPFFTAQRKKWREDIAKLCSRCQHVLRRLPHPCFHYAQVKIEWNILEAPVYGSSVEEDAAYWRNIFDRVESSMFRLESHLTERVPTILSILKRSQLTKYFEKKYSSSTPPSCSLTYSYVTSSNVQQIEQMTDQSCSTVHGTLYFSDSILQPIDEVSILHSWCTLVAEDAACAQVNLWLGHFVRTINNILLVSNKKKEGICAEFSFDTSRDEEMPNRSVENSGSFHLVPLLLFRSLLDEVLNALMDFFEFSLAERIRVTRNKKLKSSRSVDGLALKCFAENWKRISIVFNGAVDTTSSFLAEAASVKYRIDTGELFIAFTKNSIPFEREIRQTLTRSIVGFVTH